MAVRVTEIGFAARVCALMLCAYTGFTAVSGEAQSPALAMLDRLEPGLWQVYPLGASSTNMQFCIDNGRRLIQIRHPRESCKRFVIQDTPGTVTVQYTCPAGGYGHTKLRFENPRLVQLETQGIDDGLPFNFAAEVRRIGACRP